MELIDKIRAIIEPALNDMGFDVVRIQIQGGSRKTLQVMIDRQDDTALTVDHCADASHTISALMDVDDPIEEHYSLEVSSPGLDRPLVALKDFDKFKGQTVKVELKMPQDGQRRFMGLLQGIEGSQVSIDVEGRMVTFNHDDIQKAKIVPNYDDVF